MSDDKMNKQFENRNQRAAVCNSYFEREDVEGRHGGQHGRPGPNDPRKTPAKPSERRKGSKKNKPGSAKKPNTGIKISKQTENTLRKMMEKHNKAGKGSKATMGALKAVYRRGAGAFSRSHAPRMSRGGWAIARVRAFLYLLRNGRPSNPNYKQDNDLLPKSHPRSSKKADESVEAAEYRGRKVTLNKPFRTPDGPKKFAVYTKNESGTVVIVRFGDPNMEIKRDDPDRRRNFRKRHNCESPGPKWKARYWSCKMWESKKSVTDYTSNLQESQESSHSNMTGCGELKADCGCGCSDTVEAGMEDYIFMTREGAEKKSKDIGMGGAIHTEQTADGVTMYFPGPDDETFQRWFDKNDSHEAMSSDYYDNPGAAMQRARELGCRGMHSHVVNGETRYMPCRTHEAYNEALTKEAAEPTPKSDETHDEYMTRCMAMNYTRAQCMEAHKGHKFKDQKSDMEYDVEGYGGGGGGGGGGSYDSCPPGYEKRQGRCERVAVTIDVVDLSIDSIVASASDGRKVVRISGIAFHQGINKNGWEITRAGADLAVSQMVGADLTLNHPKSENGRFRRNMDGGIDEAVVGVVTEATVEDVAEGMWNVRFKADVLRTELFEALESGLWLRKGYGVSIGGSGVPDEVFEAKDGKTVMRFESDFEFDHLAIVHRPAYDGAVISDVEVVQIAEEFNSHPNHASNIARNVTPMTNEEEFKVEASEEEVVETPDYESEIAALRASLAEREAEVEAFKAAEEEAAEAARAELVASATELGMSGHEDLPAETLNSLIASWKAARPAEAEVVLEPVVASESTEVAPAESGAVVANYLNQKRVETPEGIYERAYNVWAKAWNGNFPESDLRAPLYSELKENHRI